jgi:hypothetical protein
MTSFKVAFHVCIIFKIILSEMVANECNLPQEITRNIQKLVEIILTFECEYH